MPVTANEAEKKYTDVSILTCTEGIAYFQHEKNTRSRNSHLAAKGHSVAVLPADQGE